MIMDKKLLGWHLDKNDDFCKSMIELTSKARLELSKVKEEDLAEISKIWMKYADDIDNMVERINIGTDIDRAHFNNQP